MSNPPVTDAYAGGDSTVAKDAKERKRGGKVKDEKHHVDGKKPKMHLGRPGRKMGGRIGCDKAPLSSAAKVTSSAERD
jgi:hypothetical protein